MLITFGPGPPIMSRFGHSTIWIHDASAGTDLAYNYGMSNTGDDGFFRDLIGNRVVFRPLVVDASFAIESYVRADRTVWIQTLNLEPAQARALQDRLADHARAGNPGFAFDFYQSNCTTWLRDVLDHALGGQLRTSLSGQMIANTYRSMSLEKATDDLLLYGGLYLGMSGVVDEPLTAWDALFLPSSLREGIRGLYVTDELGNRVPLVAEETVWYRSSRSEVPPSGPHAAFLFLVGVAAGTILFLLGHLASGPRSSGLTVLAFTVATATWLLAVGMAGLVLSALWGFTNQYVAHGNENLLAVNPACLLLAWFVITSRPRTILDSQGFAWFMGGIAFVGLVGAMVKLLPGFDQANWPILATIVPTNVGLAAGLLCRRVAAGRESARGIEMNTGSLPGEATLQ